MKDLTDREFHWLASRLADLTGIQLNIEKKIFMFTRLEKRFRELQIPSINKYVQILNSSPDEVVKFVNSLTTNKTDWFRESDHFDVLVKFARTRLSSDSKTPLTIWSAACSTGEEVYSIAFSLLDSLPQSPEIRILGSDIDTEVLAKAQSATYNRSQVASQVPPHTLHQKFESLREPDTTLLRVREEFRKNIKFRQFNLLTGRLPVNLQFDVIFLRNVLIYFSRDGIQQTIDTLSPYLKPHGLFFVGHSETLHDIAHSFKQVGAAVFKKAG